MFFTSGKIIPEPEGHMLKFIADTWYLWTAIAIVFAYRLFEPAVKGFIGEKTIAFYLGTLPKKEYVILHDVLLPTESGTTQTDHIVVSGYGVFIIETKNYTGRISGTDQSAQWTQNIYGHKSYFMNPLRQNYAHINAVGSLLSQYGDIKPVSIIAFSRNCDLKVTTSEHVVYFDRVRKTILGYKDTVLTPEDVPVIAALIRNGNIGQNGSRKEHVRSVSEKKTAVETAAAGSKCPKCEGILVERKGKNGVFIGCSRFPKCRFTKEIQIKFTQSPEDYYISLIIYIFIIA